VSVVATDPRTPARAPILVVGVGSELRSDDAAGRRVADAIMALDPPDVAVLSVHQLTPELAAELADRRLVIVIDASVDVTAVQVRPVGALATTGATSHHLGVPALVAMSELLGAAPTAVQLIALPVSDLGIGGQLSATTSDAVDRAVDLVTEMIATELAEAIHGRGARAPRA
jgi:hydrogenase maturation protease